MNAVSRRTFIGMAGVAGLALLGGCASGGGSGSGAASGSASASGASAASASGAASSASASASASAASASASTSKVVIGTLATEDILPYWVALDEGLFTDAGFAADVVTFQSATELIAAVAAREVDLAMTDIMVAASIFASGVDISMKWVTLGATADQGRFGIMVGPNSSVQTLNDLAKVPIGVGSNTILEYVMDRLMESAGVSEGDIVVEELQKLPVRYQAMASGEVAAAALPGSLLALGEANGCRTIADDSTGDNISQSVMIVQASRSDPDELAKLEDVWNEAVTLINANPESYRALLVEKANLSPEVAQTYPISTYPSAALPTAAMVTPVLEWMDKKGYLTRSLTYDPATGSFSA